METKEHQVFTYSWPPYGHTNDLVTGSTGTTTTIKDNVNPNFRNIQSKGGIIMSDCVISRVSREITSGSQSASVPGWAGTLTGDLIRMLEGAPPAKPATDVLPANRTNLFIKAFANINNTPVMAGENLATLGQTVGMLRSPFGSARKLIQRIRNKAQRYTKKTGRMVPQAMADAWLEERYGWKPIILDCREIIKESHKVRDSFDRVRRVARAGDSFSTKGSGSWPLKENVGGGRASEGTESWEISTRHNVGVIYWVTNGTSSDQLAAFFGTRLRDIPATLWELTPFSFVADWFTNIGDWIQAVTPNPAVSVAGTWSTVITNTTKTRSGTSNRPSWVPSGTQYWVGSYGSEKIISFSYNRDCSSPLTFTPSLTGKPLSAIHQIDALALTVQPLIRELSSLRH